MEPEIGKWFAVKAGPQKGQAGVVDFIRDFPTGRYYRLTNPHTKVIVGRFRAEQLVPTTAPAYESRVTDEVREQAMDMLMGRRS